MHRHANDSDQSEAVVRASDSTGSSWPRVSDRRRGLKQSFGVGVWQGKVSSTRPTESHATGHKRSAATVFFKAAYSLCGAMRSAYSRVRAPDQPLRWDRRRQFSEIHSKALFILGNPEAGQQIERCAALSANAATRPD